LPSDVKSHFSAAAPDIRIIEPDWPAPPGVRAAFTLRTGGVSAPPYDSLNLGSGIGDLPEAVRENRHRVSERLRLPAEPMWLEQVHGIDVVSVEGGPPRSGGPVRNGGPVQSGEPTLTGMPPKADAAVAHGPGHVCAIRVADCMPVLFAAPDGSCVGASHAGWRGLAGGVLEATIAGLGVPPSQLLAWMGPAIGPEHFEVGDDVRMAFLAKDAGSAQAFVRNARGRWQCDLYALARRRLAAAGVSDVYGGGWCTFADADRFFSYRRDRECGRMGALIWMESLHK